MLRNMCSLWRMCGVVFSVDTQQNTHTLSCTHYSREQNKKIMVHRLVKGLVAKRAESSIDVWSQAVALESTFGKWRQRRSAHMKRIDVNFRHARSSDAQAICFRNLHPLLHSHARTKDSHGRTEQEQRRRRSKVPFKKTSCSLHSALLLYGSVWEL